MLQDWNNMAKYSQRVAAFIAQHQLLVPGARVLVALSGGADSVALLRVLLCLGYRCYAVHCNFHLRGEESVRDERFVVDLCEALGVCCDVVHFDTQTYAETHKLSVEMAARELRYREFERIRQSEGLDAIAVAHHQDDAVETFLLNLIRGAGINGLTGMKVKNGYVVRPLLCLTRDEVVDCLHCLGQSYVVDSTNLTEAYARNKVRLGLLPMMEKINPAARANIARTANHLADASYIYNKVIKENCNAIVVPNGDGVDVDIETLMAVDAPELHLFEILYPYGFRSKQVNDIFRSLGGEPGRWFYSERYTALKDRKVLSVRPTQLPDIDGENLLLPDTGTLVLPDGRVIRVERFFPDASWSVPKRPDVLCLDAKRIVFPLVVRRPREADRFQPFGMRGTKLLSDYYSDIKLSCLAKLQQWLLCHGDEVVWAVGMRGSERYRIDEGVEEVICITLL